MSRNAEQKIKLLVLYELLLKQSDEEHPMTTNEIVGALKEYGIEVTRKTLYEDIDILIRYGYDVVCVKSRNNKYFVGERTFEKPEVEILLNIVGAAQFLSEKKTTILTQKIADLLGTKQAGYIEELVSASPVKHNNEKVYQNIDAISNAILNKKQLSFQYFDYGLKGERLYRKNKERYEVNPLGMIYSGDNLYLVCFHDKYGDPANYRIDRMDEVNVERKAITQLAKFEDFNINEYRKELFSMYVGERVQVELLFPRDLLPHAIERFGENLNPIFVSDETYLIKVMVRISKTFFSWLTVFNGRVKIKDPQSVQEQYRQFILNLAQSL